jgi:hypothetical protein
MTLVGGVLDMMEWQSKRSSCCFSTQARLSSLRIAMQIISLTHEPVYLQGRDHGRLLDDDTSRCNKGVMQQFHECDELGSECM